MWQTDTIIHNWKWIIFFFKWCRLNGGNFPRQFKKMLCLSLSVLLFIQFLFSCLFFFSSERMDGVNISTSSINLTQSKLKNNNTKKMYILYTFTARKDFSSTRQLELFKTVPLSQVHGRFFQYCIACLMSTTLPCKIQNKHTHTHISTNSTCKKVFQKPLLRLQREWKNTHGTATGHIELPVSSKRRYSDNLPTHFTPHEQRALPILKMDSNLSSPNGADSALLLCKCTGSVTLQRSHQTLTSSCIDDIVLLHGKVWEKNRTETWKES